MKMQHYYLCSALANSSPVITYCSGIAHLPGRRPQKITISTAAFHTDVSPCLYFNYTLPRSPFKPNSCSVSLFPLLSFALRISLHLFFPQAISISLSISLCFVFSSLHLKTLKFSVEFCLNCCEQKRQPNEKQTNKSLSFCLCLLSRLHSNNLHCDCHLSWLSDWLRQRRGLAPFTQCMSPTHMRGLNVPDVQKRDFICTGASHTHTLICHK